MSTSKAVTESLLYSGSISLAATTFISGISWGVMTSLYVVCMRNVTYRILPKKKASRTMIMLAGWVSIMWVLSSLNLISNAYVNIYAFSWKMNYPGEPVVYVANEWSQPIPSLAEWSYALTMWIADGLMLWRLFIFYYGTCTLARVLILSFASLMYICMIGVSCFSLALAATNRTLYSKLAMEAIIPAFVLSMALCVYVTAFISIRLLLFKRWMRKNLGHEETRASPYTSIAAMLIESSALYATWSLVFIVVYVIGSPGEYVMDMTLCSIQVISPLMIVYRVSKGLGWENNTSERLAATMTRMSFAEVLSGSNTVLGTQETLELQSEKTVSDMVFASSMELAVEPQNV